jgi:hypothetical protein
MWFVVIGAFGAFLSACSDGGSVKLPDADLTKPMCTGQLYDSCLDGSGCMSNNCKLFEQSGIQVCTQPCDGMCPASSAGPATCNNRGLCKPAAANPCHP